MGLSNLKNNYFMVFKLMAFFAAGISPVPMISGGTPAVAWDMILAKGFKLQLIDSSNDIRTATAAPSFKP